MENGRLSHKSKADLFSRIVKKRTDQCKSLELSVVQKLSAKVWNKIDSNQKPQNKNDCEKLIFSFEYFLKISADDSLSGRRRRKAWDLVNQMMTELSAACSAQSAAAASTSKSADTKKSSVTNIVNGKSRDAVSAPTIAPNKTNTKPPPSTVATAATEKKRSALDTYSVPRKALANGKSSTGAASTKAGKRRTNNGNGTTQLVPGMQSSVVPPGIQGMANKYSDMGVLDSSLPLNSSHVARAASGKGGERKTGEISAPNNSGRTVGTSRKGDKNTTSQKSNGVQIVGGSVASLGALESDGPSTPLSPGRNDQPKPDPSPSFIPKREQPFAPPIRRHSNASTSSLQNQRRDGEDNGASGKVYVPKQYPERRDLFIFRHRHFLPSRRVLTTVVFHHQPNHPIHFKLKPDVVSYGKLTHSGSLIARPDCLNVSVKLEGLDLQSAIDISVQRFNRWDPFFAFEGPRVVGATAPAPARLDVSVRTAVSIYFRSQHNRSVEGWDRIPTSRFGKVRGRAAWQDGEYGLFLRMIPRRYSTKKRADCHIWPKGTFLQIGGTPHYLKQRHMQSHDRSLWKGQSQALDLVGALKSGDVPKIEIGCADEEEYFFCIGFARHVSVQTLFDQLITTKKLLRFKEYPDAAAMAIGKALSDLVVVDDDDDDTNANKSGGKSGKFIFSLMCPLSRKIMQVPVRGRQCRHFQCFDLKTFLQANFHETAGRWRCGACESFVAYDDMEICGLTLAAIQRFDGEASTDRDRVEYHSNGSFRLMPEKALRYHGKKRAAAHNPEPSQPKKQRVQEEVIELLSSDEE